MNPCGAGRVEYADLPGSVGGINGHQGVPVHADGDLSHHRQEAALTARNDDTEQGGVSGTSKAIVVTTGTAGALGCAFSPAIAVGAIIMAIVIVAIQVIFGPILWLLKLFGIVPSGGGGGGGGKVPAIVASAVAGNGSGTLNTGRVPPDLVRPIEDAGDLCTDIGPVVIAALIDQGSGFDAAYTASDGRQGILPLSPDVFSEHGEDDDHSGQTSTFDATDSIMAGGRYLCDLADKCQDLIDDDDFKGDGTVLDCTLAAYFVGYDTVKSAKGLPEDQDLRTKILIVRGLFAKYKSGDEPKPSPTPSSGGSRPAEPPADGVTSAQFNEMFPGRNSFYTHSGLVDAMGAYPAFAGTGDDTARKRELAAFLANVGHETGGLTAVTEQNTANYGNYCDTGQPYGCPAGQDAYYGRGPIQLSWNTNYKNAGDALGLDLLHDPDLVSQDAAVAWKTALWYWMTQSGPGTSTPHDAILDSGFGETIRSINGRLECDGGNPAQVQSRIAAYQRYAEILGVPPGDRLTC